MALLSHMLKAADATGASLPPIQIESLPASSKNTIRGMTPPVSYTRVHTSTAPQPDAGAMQQKSQPAMGMMALPKQAHVFSGEDATMNMTGRPLIQDIVKSAMERTVGRAKIAEEGARHIRRRLDEAEPEEKVASDADVSTEYAHKLAAAVEYVLPHVKSAAFGPARLSETITQPPEGVSHSAVGGQLPGPGGYGHAHHQPPMSPGSQKGLPQENGQTQMENTLDTHVPGEQQLSITGGHGKTASAEVILGRNLQRMQKMAKGSKELPPGAGASAAYLGGTGGYFGARKATESGGSDQALQGAARGNLGVRAGQVAGGAAGLYGGYKAIGKPQKDYFRGALHAAESSGTKGVADFLHAAGGPSAAKAHVGSAAKRVLGGGAAGAALGAYGGYKALTHKYNDKSEHVKNAAGLSKEAISENMIRTVAFNHGQRMGRKIDSIADPLKKHLESAASDKRLGNHLWNEGRSAHSVGGAVHDKHRALYESGRAGRHQHDLDKIGSASLVDALREHVKNAADENNPAKISAGAAVPPETSAAGEAGGAPAGGMPVGPRHLVHSNESAINFKRSAAYGNRKSDLKAYLSEPALTNSTDSTLQAAFAHTGEAGTKLASEENEKVAAARALLAKITERVQAQ